MFPPLVPSGTELGPLRPEIAKTTGLEDAQVVASCSNETAAALAGLPITPGENWAYLQLGTWTTLGTMLPEPIINQASGTLNFTNEVGHGGLVQVLQAGGWDYGFSKNAAAPGRSRTARLTTRCSLTLRAPPRLLPR